MRVPASPQTSFPWLLPLRRPAAAAAGKGRELVLHGGNAGHGQISQEAKAALGGTVMIPTAAGGEVGVWQGVGGLTGRSVWGWQLC